MIQNLRQTIATFGCSDDSSPLVGFVDVITLKAGFIIRFERTANAFFGKSNWNSKMFKGKDPNS